jgi:competence protein ComEC
VAATLATAPLAAFHFDSVPLSGLPANVAALPAVAPAMWLGMVKAALGQLVVLDGPIGGVAGRLAEGLGPVARLPLAYLSWVAERFAELPGARLRLPLRSPGGVVAAYAVLGGCALAALRLARRLEPAAASHAARWRRAPRRRRIALVAGAVALMGLAAARGLAPPAPPGSLTVSFLDVGQGDATLVQHPDGTAVLFDGGPPEARTERLLRRAGVRRLAVLVATHASRDHLGGLPEVIERHPVGMLLDGGDGTRDAGYRRVLEAAARREVRRVPAVAPLVLRAGGMRISVLSPPPRPPGPPPEDPNPRAVIALVESGGLRLLLSADAESEALAPLALGDVDVMKVPHHGSADPGLPDMLDRVRPEVAAIEVGQNLYGHPAPSTLSALRAAGVRTYRTDRDGTVRVSLEHGAMEVRTER